MRLEAQVGDSTGTGGNTPDNSTGNSVEYFAARGIDLTTAQRLRRLSHGNLRNPFLSRDSMVTAPILYWGKARLNTHTGLLTHPKLEGPIDVGQAKISVRPGGVVKFEANDDGIVTTVATLTPSEKSFKLRLGEREI